jgi:hypothetical protein
MPRWIRQLFHTKPAAPIVKQQRARLGLQRLEERETPATFTVTITGDSGAGSLRDAVAQANSTAGADTIVFQAGLGAVVLTSGQLIITDTTGATTVSGPSGGTQVVERSTAGGTPNFRIFQIQSGVTASLNNLTISNGQDNGPSGGGGIKNDGTLAVTNSTISGNTALSGSGGGIYASGSLTVTTSTVTGNTANIRGGGIHKEGFGTLTVTNSIVSGNSAGNGGGISSESSVTVTNSTVSGNTSTGSGGGIQSGVTLTVTNSTVSGNTSNGSGGGIYMDGGTATLTNVTVTGNRSDNDDSGAEVGGGVRRDGGTVTLNNTLVAGNFRGTGTTRDDVAGVVASGSGFNLIGDGTNLTGITNGTNGNQIGTAGSPINPLLGTPGTYGGLVPIFPLSAGSPAINAGSNSAATNAGLTSDGRGSPFVRTFGGTVDIGAYEVQLLNIVVDNAGDPDDGNIAAGQFTLREAVRLANGNPGADTISFAPALGPITLTSGQLTLSDATGATTISGPSSGTQVIQRSSTVGTPNFRIFQLSSSAFSANLNNLTISNGNSNTGGGGISNSGTLTVTNSTISGNSGDIGGIANFGTLTVTNSTISGNSGFGSGGIQSGNTLTVTNSTISGNFGNGSGGGLFVVGGTASLTNVTVTANRSDNDSIGAEQGGGLRQNGGTVTLNNTLIAGNFRGTGNTRDDVNGPLVATSANNLIGDGTGLTGISNGSGGNLIGTGAAPINPLLLPIANNGGVTLSHALGQNSPALGKGSATVAGYSPFDQRGASRDNGIPDIGAFEVNHPLAPVGVPTTLGGMFQPKPSASANEAFVKGLYQSTLLRAPDAAGLAGWLSQLAGGTSRSVVANGFVNSIENRRNQVTFFYRYFLSREPDTAGLNGWVDILRGGTDEGQVMTGFILSNEFSGLNNNSQFVNLMYYALLSRQADTAGFNGWVNALNGGQSRGVVVNAFLRSEEGLNRVIDSLFQTYLKRYGSAGDLTLYRTFLNTNTFGQAATLILSSAEFFTNAGNNLS